ncbi:hypothetical protein Tco_1562717 [Tanacetum coccineum]
MIPSSLLQAFTGDIGAFTFSFINAIETERKQTYGRLFASMRKVVIDPQLAHSVPHPSSHCGSPYIPLLYTKLGILLMAPRGASSSAIYCSSGEPGVRSCPMRPVSSWKFCWDIFISVSFLNFHGHLILKETGQPCHAKRIKVITDGTWNSLVESASIPVLAEFRAPWRALPDDSSSC